MASLVSYCFYTDTWLGESATAISFPRLEMLAEDLINQQTRGALDSFSDLDSVDQLLVQKAICSQVDYYATYSEDIGYDAEGEGFTVGKVSVQGGASEASGFKRYLCPRAIGYLEQTGLLNRVVGVLC